MVTVREATTADTSLILAFINELAVYENAADEVVATAELIGGSLFGPGAKARALICESEGQPAGFAVYFYSYSTWLGRNGLYLEDIYVSPSQRGKGCGKALLQHVAALAVAENCGRLEWSVLDWNTPAIGFYDAAGASALNEWIRYRITGDALARLAKGRH